MRSPIKWFGGKGQMTKKLLPLIPEHVTYVEVFGGGASLLFAKPPSKVEVYNDLNSGLVNFFRVLAAEELEKAQTDAEVGDYEKGQKRIEGAMNLIKNAKSAKELKAAYMVDPMNPEELINFMSAFKTSVIHFPSVIVYENGNIYKGETSPMGHKNGLGEIYYTNGAVSLKIFP